MGGNVYELDHLHPLLWEVTIPAKAQNAERVLKIVVSYSMHCFTRKPSTDEDVAADVWYSDSREKRVFDSGRWALSKRLPSIIADLERRRCLHSGREEFITVDMVEDGRKFEYAVFFTVTKANKTEGADLNLFINSAHERIDALKYKKPIKFFVILLNRLLGKPIREAP
ncbi:MAG: hypothetical protein M0003_07840 [Acidithiobacillus sp.]|nr:hypothetical protein [Acidithiobacillus sp.]